ncbi:MAG: tRNA guanosine(34) transglycosylase Tgt [Pseudomonadota bacterium]
MQEPSSEGGPNGEPSTRTSSGLGAGFSPAQSDRQHRFAFEVRRTDGAARCGRITTSRGEIATPAFMPVGTVGTVKALYLDQVRDSGADIILGNVYHLMLRPTAERVARLGGLHDFIGWSGPILTDSGGFQVMSLAKIRKLNEQGVTFRSHIDGSAHELTPERSIDIQCLLGADIQMQLDECIALPAEPARVREAMELSLRWADRCKVHFEKQLKDGRAHAGQALFGIVQGGIDPGLRRSSAEALAAMDFPGYAIGGLAVGEGQAAMLAALEATEPFLPAAKPRYLMGVGTPEDLIEAVARGVDMFDCVMPTRNGRHGLAFTWHGRVNLRSAKYAEDLTPIDVQSDCPAALQYTRAYVHHLIRSNEYLGAMILSWVNTSFYQQLMAAARKAIAAGAFAAWRESTLAQVSARQ